MSRDTLGDLVGTSDAIIGRYERGEMVPSVEMASKLARALGVSLDFLAGNAPHYVRDKQTIKRLEDIAKLSEDDRKHIFYTLDGLIKAAKIKHL